MLNLGSKGNALMCGVHSINDFSIDKSSLYNLSGSV